MTAAPPTSAPVREHGRLHHGALGLPSVLFCIVTGAAPLTAMLFDVPVAVSGGGYAAPAAFLLATIALTIFSVGYIAMCARVTSAGGFYTFITRGLGRVVGVGSGLLIALCYMVFVAAVVGVLGYFAATSVETWTGISLPAWVYMALALAGMSLLSWFHIELTAKVLGVALVSEVAALTILGVAILAQGGAEGSPGVAAMTVTVLVGLYGVAFVLYDPSTDRALLKLGTWSPLLGVLGILAVQGLTSVAIIRYFLVTARDGFHWFSTLLAPALGFLAMAGACWLLVANRDTLAAAEDVPFVSLLPWVVLAMFLVGMGVAVWLRARRPAVYADLGHFTLTDPDDEKRIAL